MDQTSPSARKPVPASITFGYKVLRLPSLEELGIPMGGYGVCGISDRIGFGYDVSWIDRGDPLVTYEFRCFQGDAKPFLSTFRGDPWWRTNYEIRSPISGLLLSLRREQTVGYAPGLSLQYECCDEPRLPVILVPNDEPQPDSDAFYVYDRIAHFLRDNFDRIPVRDRSSTSPERLRDYVARHGGELAVHYRGHLEVLRRRVPENHRSFDIRELSAADTDLVRSVQNLRTQDLVLRDKLLHIARKYGESI